MLYVLYTIFFKLEKKFFRIVENLQKISQYSYQKISTYKWTHTVQTMLFKDQLCFIFKTQFRNVHLWAHLIVWPLLLKLLFGLHWFYSLLTYSLFNPDSSVFTSLTTRSEFYSPPGLTFFFPHYWYHSIPYHVYPCQFAIIQS